MSNYAFADEESRVSLHEKTRCKVTYGSGYSCSVWRGRDGSWRASDHYRRIGDGEFSYSSAVRAPSFFSMAEVMKLVSVELRTGEVVGDDV